MDEPEPSVDVGPLVASWVGRLSETVSDDERVERVVQVVLAILDDEFVKNIVETSRFEAELAAIVDGLRAL